MCDGVVLILFTRENNSVGLDYLGTVHTGENKMGFS